MNYLPEVPATGFYEPTYVALDIETTGSSPWKDRVVEIGLVRWKKGCESVEYSVLCRPDVPVHPHARRVHNIPDEELERAPRFSAIADALLEFTEGAWLVGHNAAGFDLPFLNMELARCHSRALHNVLLDTALVAGAYYGLHRLSLGRAASALGVPVGERHRAMPDAKLCLNVLLAILERLQKDGAERFSDAPLLFRAKERDRRAARIIADSRITGRLRLQYDSPRSGVSRRVVEPLFLRGDRLEAYEPEKMDVRSFKLERITEFSPA